MNSDKLQNVQQKLEAFLAQEKEQKERAQRCFVSYLRSIYLMKNKEVFDVFKLQIQEYAVSLGLAVAPRVRFLNKARAQRAESGGQREEEQQSEEEEELRSFKAQLKGDDSPDGGESSESEDSDESEESSDKEDVQDSQARIRLQGAGESEDDDDLRDLDLLTVKTKDIFNVTGDQESEEEFSEHPKKKTVKETKFKEAKKVLKRNFQVNTKVAFNEEGKAVQMWPPVQQAVTAEEEEEEEEPVSGINVEKAKERLKREDQHDKLHYSLRIKAKHRELRLKAKAARREASKQHRQDEDEEDEVVAYLNNHSDDEFDPDTLPDPDKVSSDEQEEEEEQMMSAKRKQSSDDEEEQGKKKKIRQQEDDEHTVLDTGLSLAEDETLALHLLGGQT